MLKSSLFKFLLMSIVVALNACGSADDTSSNNTSAKPSVEILHQFGQQTAPSGGDFTVSQNIQVDFTVIASAASGKSIATYEWSLPAGVSMVGSVNQDDGSVSALFDNIGNFKLSLTVTDSSAISSTAEVSVNVIDSSGGVNQAPVVSVLHDNGSGTAINKSNTQIDINTGSTVKFQGVVSDPDGNIFSVQWDFGTITPTPTYTDPLGVIEVSFNSAGIYNIKLNATDSKGASASSPAITINVTDIVTQAPDGSIDYIYGGTSGNSSSNGNISIESGATLTFNGLPNVPGYSYAWDFNNASVISGDINSAGPLQVKFANANAYTVQLTVGNNGATDATPAILKVTAVDPNATIAYSVNGGASSSGNVTVDAGTAIAFSPASLDASYTYNWTFGGAGNDTSGAGPINVTFANVGTYQISLTAVNQFGVADKTPDTITVTVQTPVTPDANIAYDIQPGSGDVTVDTGSTINFSATPVNASYTYHWTFNNVIADTTGAGPIPVTFASAGVYQITLTAFNASNVPDPTPASITVTVHDPVTAPNADITYLIGGSPGSADFSIDLNTSVIFGVTPPVNTSYTYNWTFDGAASDTTGTEVTVNFSAVGIYVVTLTAVDGNGIADPTPAHVTVTVTDPNPAPTFDIVHDAGSGDGNVTRTGDISITSGATVVYNVTSNLSNTSNYTFTWDFDGPPFTTDPVTGNVSVTYDGSWITGGTSTGAGNYITTLNIVDNTGTTTAIALNVNVIVTDPPANLAPDGTIAHDLGSGVTGSSGDVRIAAGSTIQFSGSGSDPEGSAISYAWDFGGGGTPNSATTQNIGVLFDQPGTYTAQLTVSDASGLADPTPAQVIVTVLPAFKNLPVITPTSQTATTAVYDISVDAGIDVPVVTPNETWTTPMSRYNNLSLPPVIKATRGETITVNVTNNMIDDTTIHWHGLKVAGDQDGGPDFPIAPNGGTLTYTLSIDQAAAPLWFHPHPDMTTGTQVYDGLAGALIINDSISSNLESNNQLPSGDHDVALLIQDRLFDATTTNGQRQLIYQSTMANGFLGMLGDRVLVNDVQLPAMHVDTRQYRLRLYNGSNARTYDVALSDASTFSVVASDGGLLPSPVSTNHVMLAPGERAEIVVDFSNHIPGDSLRLVSNAFNGGMMGGGAIALPNGAAFDIMSFEVKQNAADNVALYAALPNSAEINTRYAAALGFTPTPGQPLQAQTTYNERPFVMSVVGGAAGAGPQFLINGISYDATVVNETVQLPANTSGGNDGVTEVWTITNSNSAMMMAMAHPFHAHAIQWQILDRSVNGVVSAPQVMDSGWKDTFLVQPGETVRIMGFFDPAVNTGRYMYHCHILEHEDNGMMGIFEVVAQ